MNLGNFFRVLAGFGAALSFGEAASAATSYICVVDGTTTVPSSVPCASWQYGNTSVVVYTGAGYPTISNPVSGPGSVTTAVSNSWGNTSAQVESGGEPKAFINASVSSIGFNAPASAKASLEIEYYVDIVGPSGLVAVGVKGYVDNTVTLSPGGAEGNANGSLSVYASTGLLEFGQSSSGGSEITNIDQSFQTTADSPFEVLLYAGATVTSWYPDFTSGSGVSYVDPYFFVNTPGYSIVISPGIANSLPTGIPEPSTWAMMLIGFAGLGYAGYRARKHSVVGLP
jgi:hypothetical protein